MSTFETTDLAACTDLARHGGKAINLAHLIGDGFPVPDGICLGTDWYRAHVERAAGASAQHILGTPMAAELRDPLVAAYHALGGGPVAVRSSATAEDLLDASFAGQQDTYLNVSGDDEVVEAVQRCWASLWNERAVDYRRRHDVADAELAVIVQTMVDARTAGVTFTANPLTGRRGEVVIDAVPGLGEALVSGLVNPDHFVVQGAHAHAAEGTCLDTPSLQMVVDECRRIEASFGTPQDIEWAIDRSGVLWITQSRAITTLYPQPLPTPGAEKAPGERILLCASHSWQGIRGPLTPAGISALGLAAASVAATGARRHTCEIQGPRYSMALGGRWFLDVTAAASDSVGRKILIGALGLVDARSANIIDALAETAPTTSSRRAAAQYVIRLLRRRGIPRNVLRALRDPEAAWTQIRSIRDAVDADSARLRGHADAQAVATFIDRWIGTIWARVVPLTGLGMALAGVGARAAGVATDDQLHVAALRAVPGNITAQMDLDLDRIVASAEARRWLAGRDPADLEQMRRAGRLPDIVAQPLTAFLDEHGHRAVGEIDLGTTRWSADATPVLATLIGMAGGEERSSADLHAQAQAEAARAIAALAARSRTPGLVHMAYGRARRLLGLREHAKYLNVRVLAGAHDALADIGERLVRDGVMNEAGDVFFLELAEIQAALLDGESRVALVAARREEFARELRRARVPQVVLGDGTEPVEPVTHEHADALRGVAGSAGAACGVARVVTDPVGASLEPGEVLVAPTTDPAWTPLFWGAAAIVVETGGVNSHGAVVAREFGIPAVLGVRGLTSAVATGDLLEVNGSAGSVRVVRGAGQEA